MVKLISQVNEIDRMRSDRLVEHSQSRQSVDSFDWLQTGERMSSAGQPDIVHPVRWHYRIERGNLVEIVLQRLIERNPDSFPSEVHVFLDEHLREDRKRREKLNWIPTQFVKRTLIGSIPSSPDDQSEIRKMF